MKYITCFILLECLTVCFIAQRFATPAAACWRKHLPAFWQPASEKIGIHLFIFPHSQSHDSFMTAPQTGVPTTSYNSVLRKLGLQSCSLPACGTPFLALALLAYTEVRGGAHEIGWILPCVLSTVKWLGVSALCSSQSCLIARWRQTPVQSCLFPHFDKSLGVHRNWCCFLPHVSIAVRMTHAPVFGNWCLRKVMYETHYFLYYQVLCLFICASFQESWDFLGGLQWSLTFCSFFSEKAV